MPRKLAENERIAVVSRVRDYHPAEAQTRAMTLAAVTDRSPEQDAELAMLRERSGYDAVGMRVLDALADGDSATLNALAEGNIGTLGNLADRSLGPPNTGRNTPPGNRTADPARRLIENRHRDGSLPDRAADRLTGLLGRDHAERPVAARYVEALGDPAYERAFMALLADPTRGHMLWTAQEQAAYKKVQQVRAAMTTGTGTGGDMIPLTLDPTLLIDNAGSVNPIRRLARVVQTVTDSWQGVTTAGATAEWKAEGAQAADGSPATTPKPINVYMADVDVPYSYEVGQDAVNFQSELERVMTDAVDQLTVAAYTTGATAGQPKGFVPNSTAPTRTAGAFTVADVYLLQNSLPARHSSRAQWAANIAVLNAIAQFQLGTTQYAFPEIRNDPPRLLTKPVSEISSMTADMATAASRFLAYGNFQEFVIVDRLGSVLEILPGYGANQRPTAQRHAFLTFRTGSDLVMPNAIKVIAKT